MSETEFYSVMDGNKSTDDFYTYNSRDFDESWGADTVEDLGLSIEWDIMDDPDDDGDYWR